MTEFDNGVNTGVFIEIDDTLTKGTEIVEKYFNSNDYEIVGRSSELNEEDCKRIVHQCMNGKYENYNTFIDMSGFECFDTARQSLNDLLQTVGIEKECLILIKKK